MRGEILWCRILQRNELVRPMMSQVTLTHHQPANHQPAVHLANIGSRGLSSFAQQWVWIRRFVCAAQVMIVDDAITEGKKIAEVLARLGIASTGPPKRRQSTIGYSGLHCPSTC
jgi:hypothetical protein